MPGAAGGPLRRVLGRVGVRLALLLSATLLPLGVILVIQIGAVERENEARTRSALTGATLMAGAQIKARIEEARGAARALAAVLAARPDACTDILRAFVRSPDTAPILAEFVPPDGGAVLCGHGPGMAMPALAAQPGDGPPAPRLTVERAEGEPGLSLIVVSHPVIAADDRLLGHLRLALRHRDMTDDAPMPEDGAPIALLTFDSAGEIITASGGIEDARGRVPADRALKALTVDRPIAFQALSQNGFERVYSVVPIVEGTLFLMGSWRVEAFGGTTRPGGLPPLAFALLMWTASLLTALLGTERLVSRDIRALGRSMTAFAGGDRRVAVPDLRAAPVEIRAVGAAYARLTEAIVRDEAELQNALHHKDVLLREVHHRVKNNLQLIASIMRLQLRKVRSPEARSLLRVLQDRVMSLATVHRELYQTSGEAEIRADELLSDITRQVLKLAIGTTRRLEVRTAFDPIVLSSDQTVPLALLLTEALTNAIKHAGAAEGAPSFLSVTLRSLPEGRACLEIVNSLPSADAASLVDEGLASSTSLGSQLIAAFAQQVGGRLTAGAAADAYRLHLDFPLHDPPPDAEAEARADDPQDADDTPPQV